MNGPNISTARELPLAPLTSLLAGLPRPTELFGVQMVDSAIRFMVESAIDQLSNLPVPTRGNAKSITIATQFAQESLGAMNTLDSVVQFLRIATSRAATTDFQLANQIVYRVGDFVEAYKQGTTLSPMLNNITAVYKTVLQNLQVGQPMNITDISKLLGQSPASVTGVIDRLEEFPENPSLKNSPTVALAQRIYSREDRRKVFVEITPMGNLIAYQAALDSNINEVVLKVAMFKNELRRLL